MKVRELRSFFNQVFKNLILLLHHLDDYQIHENEEVNFIKSGQNWYGDVFDIVNSRIYLILIFLILITLLILKLL